MKIESLGTPKTKFSNEMIYVLILQFDGKYCNTLQCKINVPNAITNITKLLQTHHLPRRSVLFVYEQLSFPYLSTASRAGQLVISQNQQGNNELIWLCYKFACTCLANSYTLSFFMISLATFIWIGIIIFKFLSI